VFALAAGGVNYGRWGNPLVFADFAHYGMSQDVYPDRLVRMAAYGAFNLSRIWIGLSYYFVPLWAIVRPDWQFLWGAAQTRLFDSIEIPPSSFLVSDPLLLGLCVVGVLTVRQRDAVALLCGWLWSRRADKSTADVQRESDPKNPLELVTAFMFAGLFLAMLIITQLAVTYLGQGGVYTLAAIMGVSDVDPFIMGLTQAAGSLTPVKVAAGAILIAAASNNVVKGIYAYSLADKKTGLQSLLFLIGLAAAGLIPLFWLG